MDPNVPEAPEDKAVLALRSLVRAAAEATAEATARVLARELAAATTSGAGQAKLGCILICCCYGGQSIPWIYNLAPRTTLFRY
jgi:hypothetical protein